MVDNLNISEDLEDMVEIGNKFYLHKSISNKLYNYQQEGVLWFWNLYQQKQGGILGDDMGLGKTIQVIAFLSGMFDAELVERVLIVAPVAVLVNWETEFKKWACGIRVKQYHGNKRVRERNLQRIVDKSGILLTTYGMVMSNSETLSESSTGDQILWDYIILDEGHKIKNATKTSKGVRSIPARMHYILTGTPIQNNLSELWSLFDFTQQGHLLGTHKTFKTMFEHPITKAREKDTTAYQKEYGNKISLSLRNLISPFFLRRTKAEVFKKTDESALSVEKGRQMLLTKKHDLVVWLYLSEKQLKLYEDFVKSDRVKNTLITTRSPLAELLLLKKIADHPRLLSSNSRMLTEEQKQRLDEVDDATVEELIRESGKMIFLVYLMENLRKGGHRVIIFSLSRKMLDIIERVLHSLDHKILRIDGRMKNPNDREKVQEQFKTNTSYNVLLMTTQVGSVGINLTCADRLVIFDPSWNPGTDAQAVDRVYRIGQQKDVIVYRLITCGTIEEKIYRKQIFKTGVMKQTTGASDNPYRYFTNQELRDLFVLEDPRRSETQLQLASMHGHKTEDNLLKEHLHFLECDCVFGVSHHNMLFSQEAINEESLDETKDVIESQVKTATRTISEEINTQEIVTKKKIVNVYGTDTYEDRAVEMNNRAMKIEPDDVEDSSILSSADVPEETPLRHPMIEKSSDSGSPKSQYDDVTNRSLGTTAEEQIGDVTNRSLSTTAEEQIGDVTNRSLGTTAEEQLGDVTNRSLGTTAEEQIGDVTNRSLGTTAEEQISDVTNWSLSTTAEDQIGDVTNRSLSTTAEEQIGDVTNRSLGTTAEEQISDVTNRSLGTTAEEQIDPNRFEKLSQLKTLLLRNMGNSSVDDHDFIMIGDLIEYLKL